MRPMAELAKLLWQARNALIPISLKQSGLYFAQDRRRFFQFSTSSIGDGRCFTTADAERGNSAAEFALLERSKQRDDDARARRADGMAERASAAVDVDFFVGNAEIAHRRHRDNGEGLVDFEQVDFRK